MWGRSGKGGFQTRPYGLPGNESCKDSTLTLTLTLSLRERGFSQDI